jgi:hypothetical protein
MAPCTEHTPSYYSVLLSLNYCKVVIEVATENASRCLVGLGYEVLCHRVVPIVHFRFRYHCISSQVD